MAFLILDSGFWICDFEFEFNPKSAIQNPKSSFNMASLEALVEIREHLATRVGNQHVIFNSHAAFTRQVNARFDRHDHSGSKFIIAANATQRRKLMYFAADSMPQAVSELIFVTCFVDDVSGDAVGLRGGYARP